MRAASTYRSNRRRRNRGTNAKMCKAERLELGITRSQHDRLRGEMYNDAQRLATAAKQAL